MKTEEILSELEKFAPLRIQESWDNSGIQIKSHNNEITAIVLSLDISLNSISFAEKNNANLIISHHPLFFSSFKNISIDSIVGKIISKCFEKKINIISLHTNIDATFGGLADYVAKKIGLTNVQILSPKKGALFKIVTFIPEDILEKFLEFLVDKEISIVGNYKACSFYTKGKGTFYPFKDANPYCGNKEKLNKVSEYRIEIEVKDFELNKVVSEIVKLHPYEEPLINIYPLSNDYEISGFGRIGELEKEMKLEEFLAFLKSKLKLKNLRYVQCKKEPIKKIAICPGSGMSLVNELKGKDVDVYITGDVKYHEAFSVKEEKLFHIIDIGHYGSEIFFVELMKNKLENFKIPIFIFKGEEIFEYI